MYDDLPDDMMYYDDLPDDLMYDDLPDDMMYYDDLGILVKYSWLELSELYVAWLVHP